jgi:hypothetical protein
MARQALNEEWLRFAKGASAVAIVLGVCAFLGNSTSRGAWANAVRGTSVAPAQQVQSAPLSYRAAWTLPTN